MIGRTLHRRSGSVALAAILAATTGGCAGDRQANVQPGSPTTASTAPERTAAASGSATAQSSSDVWPSADALEPTALPSPLPSAESGTADLVIDLDDGNGHRTSWTLTCGPTGGSHPAAEIACGVLGARGVSALPTTPGDAICSMQFGGAQTAVMSGTWRGEPLTSRFSRVNGCEISRWDDLLGVLPAP